MEGWAAVLLAAGNGTRMKSRLPKVLHEICGRPMLAHVAEAAAGSGVAQTVIVVGHQAGQVQAAMGPSYRYAEQPQPLGTGHALLQARRELEGRAAHVLVLNGDVPLVQPATLKTLMQAHADSGGLLALLTAAGGPTEGLGRVRRDGAGRALAVVEAAEAGPEDLAIDEVNVGVYCFRSSWLWPALEALMPSRKGEVYLTDLVAAACRGGQPATVVRLSDAQEGMGVDTRLRLAEAEGVMRQRLRRRWMLEGVTLQDPSTIYIDAVVQIGQDTLVRPNCLLLGGTVIGPDCEIGPGTVIANSTLGAGCKVVASFIRDSVLEPGVSVGPFSHLRSGAYVETGAYVGNYVEIKNSRMGAGAKSSHFSYLGDATIGRDANIGAGTVTCNFDGVQKLPTVIEDGAFIGCDTMLVAPVRVGARARTGAGAVVTRDVAAGTTVAGVPARPLVKGQKTRPRAAPRARRPARPRAAPQAEE